MRINRTNEADIAKAMKKNIRNISLKTVTMQYEMGSNDKVNSEKRQSSFMANNDGWE